MRLTDSQLTNLSNKMANLEKWQSFANEINHLFHEVEKEENKVPSDEHPDYCEASYQLQDALDEIERVHGIKPKRVKKPA